MIDNINLPAIPLLIFGVVFFFRNARLLRNPERINDYVLNSPKAHFLRSKFGHERAVVLTQKWFLPLGLIASDIIIIAGLFFLFGPFLFPEIYLRLVRSLVS